MLYIAPKEFVVSASGSSGKKSPFPSLVDAPDSVSGKPFAYLDLYDLKFTLLKLPDDLLN